ncbi:uncharacterized protein TNIN_305621 [Trichonephila inaurata madagascariensis]|uniref:Gustatory receptor n=1 Tax=Trichonephila inaurata madagascariensis TaxID=2747483 RepID=A0A8X7BUJ0_9ARAC|nr:uncharacterized protein TNIN_305621 [Trichonephila inaurata madagascariensis]
MYYCNQFLEIVMALASMLWFIALLLFALYYNFVCSFIRVLLENVYDKIDADLLPDDLENLFLEYGNIARCMRSVDEHFSLPVFLAVFFTMAGLFWSGYRIAFYPGDTNIYYLSLIISPTFYLSVQLLILVSASITNELANKVKCVIQCLPYKNFLQDPQRRFTFKKNLNQDNSLTLWKVYAMDRSLIIACLGTLLTYGILIGTLGKDT